MSRNNDIVVACVLVAIASPATALGLDSTDARAIMQAVEDRDTGPKMTSHLTMTITDGSGRQRVRSVQNAEMRFPGGTKRLLLFEAPADVRGTALLTVEHDDGDKPDDQWLYLPSQKKSLRISGAEKANAFMGSDFSYSDMSKEDPDHYDYTLLEKSVMAQGDDCWLIEARPRTDRARTETGYVKSHLWISKSKLMMLQAKAWLHEGKKIKLIKLADVKNVDAIWVAQRLAARTLRGEEIESTTVLTLGNVKIEGANVSENDFTQRRLEQGL